MTATKTQTKTFVGLLIFLFILLLFILKPFLMPIILATVLVILFYPLYSWFLNLSKGHAYIASILTTFSVTAFIFIPAGLIASLVANQILNLVDKAVQFVDQAHLFENLK